MMRQRRNSLGVRFRELVGSLLRRDGRVRAAGHVMRSILAIASLGGPLRQADAQYAVLGRVIAADGAAPISGAIVEVRVGLRRLGQTLTTSSGDFSFPLAERGEVTLRVLRIGFRPYESIAVSQPTSAAQRTTIVVAERRVSLGALLVRARERCVIRPDSGAMLAVVWEEARKAMLASRLNSASGPLLGEWFTYDRRMDSTGSVLLEQRVRTHRLPTTHVFRSVSPQALAALGFVISDESGFEFHAPDAEVLLSDPFVSTHCFKLTRGTGAHAAQIGVSFAPTRVRHDQHEIEGTIWVDRGSAELRSIEYSYTGFPRLQNSVAPGGVVHFVRLQSGNWLVSEWRAQVPLLRISRGTSAITELGPRRLPPTSMVREVRVAGGELERATQGDSTLFHVPRPAVRVELRSRSGETSVAGALVSMRGTDLSAVTDAKGQVRIGPVPQGRYFVSVSVPAFDSLGAAPLQVRVDATSSSAATVVELPEASELIRRLCGSDTTTIGTAILRGTIRNPSGEPMRGAELLISFLRADARYIHTGTVRWVPTELRTTSDENGRWQFCGVPRETDIAITANHGEPSTIRRVRIERVRSLLDIGLTLPELPPPRFGTRELSGRTSNRIAAPYSARAR